MTNGQQCIDGYKVALSLTAAIHGHSMPAIERGDSLKNLALKACYLRPSTAITRALRASVTLVTADARYGRSENATLQSGPVEMLFWGAKVGSREVQAYTRYLAAGVLCYFLTTPAERACTHAADQYSWRRGSWRV